MTYAELYESGLKRLEQAGVPLPKTDAFILLEAVTGFSRAKYILVRDRQAQEKEAEDFLSYISRRAERVPCQYILGRAWFYGLCFKVDESVLIPRFDTEILVEEALSLIPEKATGLKLLDMCSGSGCIGITLKHERPELSLTFSDISGAALELAKENAGRNLCEGTDSPDFVLGDLFENINGSYDFIVSNPPYVSEAEFAVLAPEVKEHEPRLALLAGEEGLDIYRRLIPQSAEHLKRGGLLLLETGCTQTEAVSGLLKENGFSDIYVKKDLAGLNRVVIGRK